MCVCVRAPPVPRQSWLGFVVRVSGFGFWLSARHFWLRCWAVCVCVRAPPVPRQFWFGCAWCVCAQVRVRLGPAIPSWGVGTCVFVCALCLHPNNPGSGLLCGFVCSGSGWRCARPPLAGVFGVSVCVRASPVLGQTWLACELWVCRFGFWAFTPAVLVGVLGCVCLCARSACTSPILAGVSCVGVRAGVRYSAAPRHSWQGVLGCVCLCALSACTPPTLIRACDVCVWVRVFGLHSAIPRWGVAGCVFV